MDMFFSAKRQNLRNFLECYDVAKLNSVDSGSPLVFWAMSNNDPKNRFDIVSYLIKEGVRLDCNNKESETLFHILFSRPKQIISETLKMAQKLLLAGVDINHLDSKNRLAIQWLINSPYTDEELNPIYDLIFSQPSLALTKKNCQGYSPLDLAEKIPYRTNLYDRMLKYE